MEKMKKQKGSGTESLAFQTNPRKLHATYVTVIEQSNLSPKS